MNATATGKKSEPKITVESMLASVPRVKAALNRSGVEYMGPCVVQSPGAWTRVGPTWIVPGIGWVTVGLGVCQWGTTAGLAELASQPTATPKWHALGISISPAPNLVFAVTVQALESPNMADVARFAQEVDVEAGSRS